MDKPSAPNTALDAALTALQRIDRAVDLRWLAEELRAWNVEGYRAKLHGIAGGHEDYSRGKALETAFDRMTRLSPADKRTLALVVDMLYRLMEPQTTEARGTVQLKTIIKRYPKKDWQAMAENGGITVYVLDDNGQPIMEPFPYTYAYVRLYANKADANRKGTKLLSLYADRGMGKGGTGGYVAAALKAELITEDDILDAWHASQETYRQEFIDHCASLLQPTSELPGSDTLPNPDVPIGT